MSGLIRRGGSEPGATADSSTPAAVRCSRQRAARPRTARPGSQAGHGVIAAPAADAQPCPPGAPGQPRKTSWRLWLSRPQAGIVRQPTRPPLPNLHRLPRDASMVYDIGRVDACGRIVNGGIVEALRWHAGDKLEVVLTQGAIVIRSSPDGLFSLSQRPRIIIPAEARRRHAIQPGDHVLLAAAPEFGIVIVYPLSALDEMIARYHSTYPAVGGDRR